MSNLSFINLRDYLKTLLEIQGIPYIHDLRKELNAINKFTMEGFTPEHVVSLIGRLIEIKKHPKYKSDPFWIGCAINLSDVYSYRVKIENLHMQLFPSPIQTKIPEKKPPKEINLSDLIQEFSEWCEKKLTRNTAEAIKDIEFDLENNVIVYETENEHHSKLIQKYFSDNHKLKAKNLIS